MLPVGGEKGRKKKRETGELPGVKKEKEKTLN